MFVERRLVHSWCLQALGLGGYLVSFELPVGIIRGGFRRSSNRTATTVSGTSEYSAQPLHPC